MYADTVDRVDAGRDRRDGPPAGDPGGLQHASTASSRRRSSRASATSTSGCAPSPRATVVYTSERGAATLERRPTGPRSSSSSPGWRPRCRPAAKQLEFERAAALRDEIQQIRLRVLEQDASVIVGRAAERAGERVRRRAAWPAPRTERAAGAARRPRSRPAGDGGHERHGPAGRRGAGRRPSTAMPGERRSTRTPSPTGCPGIRDEHDDDGGLAGPLARPADLGSDGHAEHPAPDRNAAGTSPPLIDPRARAPCHRDRRLRHAGSRTASDRRIRPRARQIRARVASSVRPSCVAISRVR